MTLYPWIQFKSYLTSFNLWLVNRAHWKYKSSRRCSYFLHWLSVTQFSSSDSWESLQRFQCTSEQVRVFYTNGIYYITLFCTWKTFNTYFYRLLHTWFYWSASRKKKKRGKGNTVSKYLFKSPLIWIDFKCNFCLWIVKDEYHCTIPVMLSDILGAFCSRIKHLSFWII